MPGVKTAFIVEDRKIAGRPMRMRERNGESIATHNQLNTIRQACIREDAERANLLALARTGDTDAITILNRRFKCVIVPVKGGD